MQGIVDVLRDRGTPRRRWAAASPVLALALIPLLGNRVTASRAHETMARDFAYDILQSVEPYGILITAGDNDTFPLWYAQEVEGIRPRRDARQPVAHEHRVAPAPARGAGRRRRSIRPRAAPLWRERPGAAPAHRRRR